MSLPTNPEFRLLELLKQPQLLQDLVPSNSYQGSDEKQDRMGWVWRFVGYVMGRRESRDLSKSLFRKAISPLQLHRGLSFSALRLSLHESFWNEPTCTSWGPDK